MADKLDETLETQGKGMRDALPSVADKLSKDLDPKAFGAALEKYSKARVDLNKATLARKAAVNAKQAAAKELRTMIKRVRSSVKGGYGDDSTEYELVGGTRLSDRKKPVRKAKKVA